MAQTQTKNLNDYYKSPLPTLKNIAIVKIISTIFNKIYGDEPIDAMMFDIKSNMFPCERRATRILDEIHLPYLIRNEITYLLKCMSFELSTWPNSIIMRGCPKSAVVSQIVWTPFGTIDDVETYLRNKIYMSEKRAFARSCRLCLQYHLEKIWTNKYGLQSFAGNRDDELIQYWILYCKGLSSSLTNYELFWLAMDVGNEFSVKYFWEMLPPNEKEMGFYKFMCMNHVWNPKRYADVLIFMFSKMSEDQLKVLFKNNYTILSSLVMYFPYEEACLTTLDLMFSWNCISDRNFLRVCRYLLLYLIPKFPIHFKRNDVFYNIWTNFSINLNKEDPDNHNLVLQIVDELFTIMNNIEAIEIIASSMWFRKIKESLIYSDIARGHYVSILKTKGPYQLDDYMSALQLSPDEKLKVAHIFKNNFKDYLFIYEKFRRPSIEIYVKNEINNF